jgi:hypothetical protein
MGKMLKNMEVIVEDEFGVCLWCMPDGNFLGDDEGRFLSSYGKLDDIIIEEKMRAAAVYYIGVEANIGQPVWVSGSRKISDDEHDDQMERMLNGDIPDIVDEVKQLSRKEG